MFAFISAQGFTFKVLTVLMDNGTIVDSFEIRPWQNPEVVLKARYKKDIELVDIKDHRIHMALNEYAAIFNLTADGKEHYEKRIW